MKFNRATILAIIILFVFAAIGLTEKKKSGLLKVEGTKEQWGLVMEWGRKSNIEYVKGHEAEMFLLNQLMPQIDTTKK